MNIINYIKTMNVMVLFYKMREYLGFSMVMLLQLQRFPFNMQIFYVDLSNILGIYGVLEPLVLWHQPSTI